MLGRTGEIMTSRARLETEVQQLRQAMEEMDGSLDRLRIQLRDMELQAESQMQSRMAQSADSHVHFDPLEFDRFTRVQELTRMMAESVSDVASVRRSMALALQSSEDNLVSQTRQARELQGDLLHTRMVEFDSLSDRLYRVVRQAAREESKQVSLDIIGAAKPKWIGQSLIASQPLNTCCATPWFTALNPPSNAHKWAKILSAASTSACTRKAAM